MSITAKKLHGCPQLKVWNIPKSADEEWSGGAFLKNRYSNVLCLAKKASGKTSIISNILDKACDVAGRTKVVIIASSVNLDQTWINTVEMLRNRGTDVLTFVSLYEKVEGTAKKINVLEQLIESLKVPEGEEDEEEDKLGTTLSMARPEARPVFVGTETEVQQRKQYMSKLPPNYLPLCVICDDLSIALRDPMIAFFAKMNRHFKCLFICSTQYPTDLSPDYWLQCDYCLMWKGFAKPKLIETHKRFDLAVDPECYWRMYQYATQEKYHFFKVAIREEKFYKDFDVEMKVEDHDQNDEQQTEE